MKHWVDMKKVSEQYDADYFLLGKQSGKSLYEDYRWLPELTIPMAKRIAQHCKFDMLRGSRVLDFGCARGYLVRALREIGHVAFGYEISQWAIDNADPKAKEFMNKPGESPFYIRLEGEPPPFDWVIAKDVLEHIEYVQDTIDDLMDAAKVGVFAVIPLSRFEGGEYVVPEYEKDVTHVQRCSLKGWGAMFVRPGWSVELAYRVPGIKDNYAKWEYGNGFLTARRIIEE